MFLRATTFVLALLAPAALAAEDVVQSYDFYLGGVRIASGEVRGEIAADGAYRARTEFMGAGWLRRLYDARMEAEVEGRILGPETLRPSRYTMRTLFGDDTQFVEIG
ncbi:MAG: DUF3108 domain-containing protein [Pseudomonadota bacterium]